MLEGVIGLALGFGFGSFAAIYATRRLFHRLYLISGERARAHFGQQYMIPSGFLKALSDSVFSLNSLFWPEHYFESFAYDFTNAISRIYDDPSESVPQAEIKQE